MKRSEKGLHVRLRKVKFMETPKRYRRERKFCHCGRTLKRGRCMAHGTRRKPARKRARKLSWEEVVGFNLHALGT